MLRISESDFKDPNLILPPTVDDNTVVMTFRPDPDAVEIMHPDIQDVALSYSVAKIYVIIELPFEVIVELPFEIRNRLDISSLASVELPFETRNRLDIPSFMSSFASLASTGGWSISILPPVEASEESNKIYCDLLKQWYTLWRSKTMRHFEGCLYPITPYVEYITTEYLIDQHKDDMTPEDRESLIQANKNTDDVYLLEFIKNTDDELISQFKKEIKTHIDQHDRDLYEDINLMAEEFRSES